MVFAPAPLSAPTPLFTRDDDRIAGRVPVYRPEGVFDGMVLSYRAHDTGGVNGPAAAPAPVAEEDNDGSFWDVLDVINPLQHIPLVSTLYRNLTGDSIGPVARMVGGALYGGPVGFAASSVNAALAEETGKDAGELAMAAFAGDDVDLTPLSTLRDDPETQLNSLPDIAPAAGGDDARAMLSTIYETRRISDHYQAQRFARAGDDRINGSQTAILSA